MWRSPSNLPYHDDIQLTYNRQITTPSTTERIDIASLLIKELGGITRGRGATTGTQNQNDLDAIHNSVLERLEVTSASVIETTSAFAVKVQEELAEGRKRNDADLKTEKATLLDEHSKRLTVLVDRELAVEKKLSEIDNRDNTHARREIRNGMLADVRSRIESFGVSQGTEGKRAPVRRGMQFLIAILTLLLGFFIYEELQRISRSSLAIGLTVAQPNIPVDLTDKFWLWGRLALTSLGLTASILYLIRWENRWAERHANIEFQLQQFHLDVNRASWVIESCLEWKKETNNSAIPAELLTSITRNLFLDQSAEPEQIIHPADELASALMGSASKATIALGGSTLEFDKPAKLKRTVKSKSAPKSEN
jgi:hypothetical protein